MSDPTTSAAAAPEEWAIVEIMGHLQRAGRISEVERFGARLLRVGVPISETEYVTELFSGGAIYRLRPATEEVARAVALRLGDPRPAMPVAYRLSGPSAAGANEAAEFEFEERD